MGSPKNGTGPRRYRAWLPAVPPALFLLAACVFWFSHVPRERDNAIEDWKKDLGLRADFRRESLDAFLKDSLVDASLLASFPAVRGVVRNSGGSEHTHFAEIVEQFRRAHGYGLVAVFDASGRPAAGLPAPPPDAGCAAAARGVLETGKPAASLHAHARGEPSLTLAAPIPDDAGNLRGVVLIVTGPGARLYPLLGETFSALTGEALLVARDGADAVYLSPLRYRSGAPLALRRPLDTKGLAAREALEKPESAGVFVDYRGEQVVAATRGLTAAPWGLVVKVDESEALEPFWNRVGGAAIGWCAGLLGVLALAWGIGQRLRRLRADADARGESRFRTLFEQASDAVFVVGEDGLVQDANRAAEDSYRAPREALIGRHVADFRPPDQRKAALGAFAAATRVDRVVFEGEHLRADGSPFPVEVSTRRAEMPGGPVHISIVRDVSGRRNVDARVRHLNRLLHTILEINQLIVRTDERTTLLAGACQILVEHGGFALVWVGLADRATGRVVPVARAGRDEGYLDEIEVRCDDSPLGRGPVGTAIRTGRRTVITDVADDVRVEPWRALQLARGFREVAAFPLRGAGPVAGALTIYSAASDALGEEESALLDELAVDLAHALESIEAWAERARAELDLRTSEEALRTSESRFRRILESMQDAYFQADGEGQFVLLSPSAPRMYGYASVEEMMGMPAAGLYFDPGERDSVLDELRRSGRTYDRVGQGKKKDGTPFWVSLSAALVRDAQGRVTGTEGLIRDVSDRVQLQAQLVQAQRMEAVGRLAGGVAHDFNNLLTVIAGYAELLNETLDGNPEGRENAGEILKAAGRATSLTRQLLAFSRRQVLELRVLNVGEVVAETQNMLRRLIGEDVEVSVVRPEGLGRVKADPGQLEQILLNLAVNARDAMPRGGRLVIELSNVRLQEPLPAAPEPVPAGRYVVITVADTGTGMDVETRSHAFEPFFTTKEKGKGTGLGLATVYGIVRQSGGYVALESSPGAGTTFRIYLPRCDEPATSGVRPAVGSSHGTETVLVVDDEPGVRALATAALERHGYTVIAAENAAAALDVVERDPRDIHVLLTDLVMPGMNGRELASAATRRLPSLKVVFMSGFAADVVDGVSQDATFAFVPKPFTERALAAKIREVLGGR